MSRKKLNAGDLFGGLARHTLANIKLDESMPAVAHQVLQAAQDAVAEDELDDIERERSEDNDGETVITTDGETVITTDGETVEESI